MKGKTRVALTGALTAGLLAAGSLTPSFAAAPATAPAKISNPSPQGACQAAWYYRSTGRGTDTHVGIGPVQSNYNGTPSPASMSVSATVTGTASATVTGNLSFSRDFIVANVAATYSISASVSLSTTLGNSFTFNVPAWKTGNAIYGVYRSYTTGREEWYTTNCVVTQYRNVKAYSPYKVGWRVWFS